jgi:hypothetical protein
LFTFRNLFVKVKYLSVLAHLIMDAQITSFIDEFIATNFDDILLQNDNPLINSDEYYIKYKQCYMDDARTNLLEYETLTNELRRLQEIKLVALSDSKVIYTFVNDVTIQGLKSKRKDLVVKQRQKLTNLLLYIDRLNMDFEKILGNSCDKSASIKSKKSVFAKLVEKKKSRKDKR